MHMNPGVLYVVYVIAFSRRILLAFSIRVFSCGHATHLQCEVPENEASSRGASSECPVCCMPKKKSHKARNKSIFAENGLVSKYSSRPQQSHGTTILHPHESDALENLYGLQQISRFEILTNLQKDQRLVQIEHMPQLRLAPPAVYHERVKKGTDIFTGESSNSLAKIEKQSKSKQLRELRVNGSCLRFPLKSSIFGKDQQAVMRVSCIEHTGDDEDHFG